MRFPRWLRYFLYDSPFMTGAKVILATIVMTVILGTVMVLLKTWGNWEIGTLVREATNTYLVVFLGSLFTCLLIWWSAHWSPQNPSGLSKGSSYRVVKSFSSGSTQFEEGEILVFKGERFYDAAYNEDIYNEDHDSYVFDVVDTGRRKWISSDELPGEDWVRFIEIVPGPSD